MRQELKKKSWQHCLLYTFLKTMLVVACRKIDTLQTSNVDKANKFFTIPPNTNKTVLRVANELKRQNALTGFINDFATKQGFPIWDKAIVKPQTKTKRINARTSSSNETADTLVLIPLVRETQIM